jgi:hypothetical protein
MGELDVPRFRVKNLETDLYKYYEHTFVFRYIDYYVTNEYIGPRQFRLHVQLLNSCISGSTDNLQVLVVHSPTTDSQIIDIGCFTGNHTSILVDTDYDIEPDDAQPFCLQPLHPSGWWDYKPNIRKIPRRRFNALFNTDIVVLPKSMFAIGVTDWGATYMYHEDDGEERLVDVAGGVPLVESVEWQNIREPVIHMLRVAYGNGNDQSQMGYFIISSSDGYLERTYWSVSRTVERQIGEFECVGSAFPPDLAENEFPVFHSAKTVFTQSGHVGLPYCVNIPDRHYFFHNLHNSFRSFHMGLPWEMKESKIVYAGQSRDNKYNFLSPKMRKLGVAPREYFKSIYAKENRDIVECDGTWIDRKDMIYYKYILDLDGTASTWDATAWKLNSGSIIFKPKSGWEQWFYGKEDRLWNGGTPVRTRSGNERNKVLDHYVPDVHFIEIEDDFSDLRSKFEWCETHPVECNAMIQCCKKLFQEVYRYSNVVKYTKTAMDRHVFRIPEPPKAVTNTIYDYIDHVFYINLDRRTDRRDHIEKTLREYGLDRFERFSAISHEFGIVGCTKSHQMVYKLAKERGYKNVLIFEDDFEFLVTPEEFKEAVIEAFVAAPLPADVYMFSYNVIQSVNIADSPLMRILEASTASCYIVQSHYYDKLIDLYEVAIPLLETTREHWKYANDQCWKALQIDDQWYGTKKRLGKQMDGYSDNSQEFMKNQF